VTRPSICFSTSTGRFSWVDPEGGHWVRFVVTRVPVSPEKPNGIDYSLTLHGPDGERLVGFDNAHSVARQKRGEPQDHRHRLRSIRPYEYRDAATLLADLWTMVDAVMREGFVTGTVARFSLAGRMANDNDLVCAPSVSACDHPARRVALFSLHPQLSQR